MLSVAAFAISAANQDSKDEEGVQLAWAIYNSMHLAVRRLLHNLALHREAAQNTSLKREVLEVLDS
jgi:hypothetical protein